MNRGHLAVLAVLALASVSVTAFVLRTNAPTIAADHRGERVLAGLADKANQISGLSVRFGSETFALDRRDSGFVASDSGYPVKDDAVRDLLAGSIALTFEEARTSDSALYGDLGLADPGQPNGGKEVVLRGRNETLADYVLGNRDNTVGGAIGGFYLRLKDQPQTWLVRGNVRLPASRSEWFAPTELGVKRNEIKSIAVSGGGRDAVAATATADKPGELTLQNVPEKRSPDTFKVGRLSSLVASFAFQDVRKRTKPADDARRMVVDLNDGTRLTVTALGDPSSGWVQISAEATGAAKLERVNAIMAQVGDYDFHLSPDQADVLGWTNTDLTDEQKS
jgi:hypothetical protein